MSNNSNFTNKDSQKRFSLSIYNIIRYFVVLNLTIPHTWVSLIGFSLFATMGWQVITGFILAMGFIPEPMYIPASRETEDLEGFHIDDIFWLHERGVDYLFLLIYMHLLRKLFMNTVSHETEASWKSGALGYLLLQAVVFFGLVLCSTHLSEITLRIAANIVASFTNFKTEIDWILFTDRTLNADTMVRMMILHYLAAGLVLLLGLFHGIDMHYDWKTETHYSGLKESVNWFDEGLINELTKFFLTLWGFVFLVLILFHDQEPLSYEMFMWGDLGLVTDVNFFAVAPHWYFRPFMAWLTMVPDHYTGLAGLFTFFFSIFFQPNLMKRSDEKPLLAQHKFYKGDLDESQRINLTGVNINSHYNLTFYVTFVLFVISLWYAASFLPYGRFFHSIGGNFGLAIAYIYVFWYLLFPSFRGGYKFFYVLRGYVFWWRLVKIKTKKFFKQN